VLSFVCSRFVVDMGVTYQVRPFFEVDTDWEVGTEGADVASYESPFDRVYLSVEKSYVERVQATEARPRLWFVTDADAIDKSDSSRSATGRERWARLNEALNGFGLTRSKNQRW